MLSSLPKLLDKTFIIGFFLPAWLGVLLVAWTFQPIEALEPLRNLAVSDKKLEDLTYVVLVVSTLAILLLTTNNLQYRLLEGYLPPLSWCKPLLGWQRYVFARLSAERTALQEEWRTKGEKFPAEQVRKVALLEQKLLTRFPSSSDQLLPTRFGNAIKAFEVYSRVMYGADAIPVWLRLGSVMSKEFAADVNDARTRVDCFVNLTFLTGLISICALGSALLRANWAFGFNDAFFWPPNGAHEMHIALAGLGVAFISYKWATVQVETWGALVKSAFDCYLPALMKQLGYAMPERAADRRAFWVEYSRFVIYQEPMKQEWPVVAPQPSNHPAEVP